MTTETRSNESQITRGFRELVAEANTAIRTYSPEEAIDRLDEDGVLFVDVRDAPELTEGRVPGAIHASRGMLEFHIDPDSPYYMDEFSDAAELVFYCAAGARSALAAQRAAEMGRDRVAHVAGGFPAWTEAGGPIRGDDTSGSQ
ncbi:rhodanese-like domain-containing protein [Haloterrigena salinisoli]|uniref:rhodanese-like domain-containing protein n=1 Tax=Haloterrigena salinisoli TaxID=3132747 RepID=UPI0030D14D39